MHGEMVGLDGGVEQVADDLAGWAEPEFADVGGRVGHGGQRGESGCGPGEPVLDPTATNRRLDESHRIR
ncbi:MAG: hypothetical protein LC792_19515 [Actinobacteria bacterium]|nr:hypothetical protein [Actinomycetota bacterium]